MIFLMWEWNFASSRLQTGDPVNCREECYALSEFPDASSVILFRGEKRRPATSEKESEDYDG